MSSAGGVKNLE